MQRSIVSVPNIIVFFVIAAAIFGLWLVFNRGPAGPAGTEGDRAAVSAPPSVPSVPADLPPPVEAPPSERPSDRFLEPIPRPPETPVTETPTPGEPPPVDIPPDPGIAAVTPADDEWGPAPAVLPAPPSTTYTTRDGDTLWWIAVTVAKDGRQWDAIREANPDLRGNAHPLMQDTPLTPGQLVTIAAPSEAAVVETVQKTYEKYTVQPGDSPSTLAVRFYGDGSPDVWREILAANPGMDANAMPLDREIRLPVIPGKGPKGIERDE